MGQTITLLNGTEHPQLKKLMASRYSKPHTVLLIGIDYIMWCLLYFFLQFIR